MRTCRIVCLAVLADHRGKIRRKQKRDKYLDLARELKKPMEYEVDGDTNCNWCTWNNPPKIGKVTGRFEDKYRSYKFQIY